MRSGHRCPRTNVPTIATCRLTFLMPQKYQTAIKRASLCSTQSNPRCQARRLFSPRGASREDPRLPRQKEQYLIPLELTRLRFPRLHILVRNTVVAYLEICQALQLPIDGSTPLEIPPLWTEGTVHNTNTTTLPTIVRVCFLYQRQGSPPGLTTSGKVLPG